MPEVAALTHDLRAIEAIGAYDARGKVHGAADEFVRHTMLLLHRPTDKSASPIVNKGSGKTNPKVLAAIDCFIGMKLKW